MDCRAVRERLVVHAAGRLPPADRDELVAHLEGCAECRGAAAVESELSAALDRLPRHHAPAALKRRLEALIDGAPQVAPPDAAATPAPAPASAWLPAPAPAPTPTLEAPRRGAPPRWSVWAAPFVSACAAAALVLVVVRTTAPAPGLTASTEMVTEAVNDHLRVVGSTHPIEIESGGIHQVKPWFTGRLEFGPRVAFSGDGDFPLVGGSVGYFRDRKAAVFVFKRRLHTITLLVFPPEGLSWPTDSPLRLGRLSVSEQTSRGFSVLLWRDAGLGYALVSDVNSHDLELLASRINPD
jgi:anti-sigma factor RsiW